MKRRDLLLWAGLPVLAGCRERLQARRVAVAPVGRDRPSAPGVGQVWRAASDEGDWLIVLHCREVVTPTPKCFGFKSGATGELWGATIYGIDPDWSLRGGTFQWFDGPKDVLPGVRGGWTYLGNVNEFLSQIKCKE